MANAWELQTMLNLGERAVPDCILGSYSTLLRGDVSRCWAAWFSEGFCSPHHIAQKELTYAEVREYVGKELEKHYAPPTQELIDVIEIVSNRLFSVAEQIRERRKPWTKKIRRHLVDSYTDQVYCKICGYRFQDKIVNAFADKVAFPSVLLPEFIDIYKPRGLFPADMQIQVDHIVPISHGGSNEPDNLQILCGWCNRHKSNLQSMYDVPQPSYSASYKGRQYNLPHEFWIVRILSLFQQPTYISRENPTIKTHELTISPKFTLGVLNPTNLLVTAYGKEDPLKDTRFVPFADAMELWGKESPQ